MCWKLPPGNTLFLCSTCLSLSLLQLNSVPIPSGLEHLLFMDQRSLFVVVSIETHLPLTFPDPTLTCPNTTWTQMTQKEKFKLLVNHFNFVGMSPFGLSTLSLQISKLKFMLSCETHCFVQLPTQQIPEGRQLVHKVLTSSQSPSTQTLD